MNISKNELLKLIKEVKQEKTTVSEQTPPPAQQPGQQQDPVVKTLVDNLVKVLSDPAKTKQFLAILRPPAAPAGTAPAQTQQTQGTTPPPTGTQPAR